MSNLNGRSIVLLGSFNPKIVNPTWLNEQGCIRASDAELADNENTTFLSKEISVFNVADIALRVDADHFQAETSNESKYEILRDLVITIFDILQHTPIEALGINVRCHYEMESEEHLHRLGYLLAPQEPWHDLLERSKMRSLTVQSANLLTSNGFCQIKVEPSVRIKNGVYVEVNNHFTFDKAGKASQATEIIKSYWENIGKSSGVLINKIVKLGDQ